MKKDITACIEFTDSHVKLLELRWARGHHIVTQFESVRLRGPEPEALDQALSQLVSGRNFSGVAALIPGRYAILKQITLPSHSDDEIENMLSLQINHLGPFPREEIVFGHIVLDKDLQGYSRVLVVVVQKENILFFLKALQKQSLMPRHLFLGSQGILTWYLFQKRVAKLTDAACVMIADVDDDNTEVCFCHHDKLFFSRNIRFGSRDMTGEKMEAFLEQIGLTLGAYLKENMGPDITRNVVIANTDARIQLAQKLEEYYRVPVDVLTSLDHVIWDKSIGLSPEKKIGGLSLTRSLGFLLGRGHAFVNLIPQEVVHTQASRIRRRTILRFTLMLLLTGLLGLGVLGAKIYKNKQHLQTIEIELRQTESRVEAAKKEIDLLRNFASQRQQRILFVDIFRELYQLTPGGINFQVLELNNQRVLSIQGNASSGSDVNLFQNRLVESPIFQEVNLQYATQRVRFRQEYTEFKIVCQLKAKADNDGP